MNSYELSRAWFDWCFENPEKISPNHTAIFFFAIEHCNRLGWKEKFGFPTQMAMDAIGIKKHQTYIKYFRELVDWGFLILVQESKNQYSSNIISLISAMPENGKALGKAIINHAAKQTESNGQSIGQSNGSIYKPNNLKQDNHKPINNSGEKISPGSEKLFWKNFISVFDDFYFKKFNFKYSYLKKDFTALEKIYEALKKQCESKNIQWGEEVAMKGWNHYLDKAFNHSEWLQSNFNTSNILSKINEILANNGKSTTSKQATGANVDNASALAKLNQMDW